jgi:hypothetical protein
VLVKQMSNYFLFKSEYKRKGGTKSWSQVVPNTAMKNDPIIIPIFTMSDKILTSPWSNITVEFYVQIPMRCMQLNITFLFWVLFNLDVLKIISCHRSKSSRCERT